MASLPEPAWAFLLVIVVVAIRDIALAWIASRATGAPAEKRKV